MRLFVLEPQHYDAFIGALDAPPPAGAELKALMKKRPLWVASRAAVSVSPKRLPDQRQLQEHPSQLRSGLTR